MARLDWSRDRSRQQAKRLGIERAGDGATEADLAEMLMKSPHRPLGAPVRPRAPRPSKAQLRAEAAALVNAPDGTTARIARCTCGHSAPVNIPNSRRGVVKLRCTKCSKPIELDLDRGRQ